MNKKKLNLLRQGHKILRFHDQQEEEEEEAKKTKCNRRKSVRSCGEIKTRKSLKKGRQKNPLII
jgi:hypothetical protein